jgi:cytoskeleton protein RodZ
MSAPVGDESRVGIGARLRAGRERAGLTLMQAAERLHVDSKVLEALEAERFDSLGAPVFARGHLRRYAELIGEQAAQLQGLYNESTRPPPLPDLTRAPKVRRRRRLDSQRLVAPGIAGLIAIAIAGGVWIVLQVLNRDAPEPATTELIVPATAAPGSAEPMPPAAPPVVAAPKAVAKPAPKATGAAEPARKARTVDVTLKFAADSWVEIYDVNGERLFYDIGSADSVRSVTGTPPLRVVLGNAPGVSLEVNGRATKVPASAMQDEGAQFTISRAGRIAR